MQRYTHTHGRKYTDDVAYARGIIDQTKISKLIEFYRDTEGTPRVESISEHETTDNNNNSSSQMKLEKSTWLVVRLNAFTLKSTFWGRAGHFLVTLSKNMHKTLAHRDSHSGRKLYGWMAANKK